MNLNENVVQAVFMRCGPDNCNYRGRILYRESADGTNWSPPETVVGGEFFGFGAVGGVTFAHRPIVTYTHNSSTARDGRSKFRLP